MKGRRRFRHESLQDQASITAYLDALKSGFNSGTIALTGDDGELVLTPHGLVHFGLDATEERGRVRLLLEFSWKVPPPEGADNALEIRAVEPRSQD